MQGDQSRSATKTKKFISERHTICKTYHLQKAGGRGVSAIKWKRVE